MMTMRALWRAGALACAALVASAAGAGPLVISPTVVTMEPGRRNTVVEVENAGDDAADIQFRAYDWTQPDGRDRLTPSDTLVVSPAIATVPPHGRQLFRILQMAGPIGASERERSFRLRVNQLPRPGQAAVAVNLEFSVPVFQAPAGATAALRWRLTPDGLIVSNVGGRRTRIVGMTLRTPEGASVPVPDAGFAYLLSGASRLFRPAHPVTESAELRLSAALDTGTVDVAPAPADAH